MEKNEIKGDPTESQLEKVKVPKMRMLFPIMLNYVSLNFINFEGRFLTFYQVVMGFSPILLSIAYSIFTIWDAINDPFLGFWSDRPKKFWLKRGKRLPLIITGFIGVVVCAILLVIPSNSFNDIILFIYFLCLMAVFDASYAFWKMNLDALRIERTKTDTTRYKYEVIKSYALLTIGLLANFLPALTLGDYSKGDYLVFILVSLGIALIIFLFSILGMKETKEQKEFYLLETQRYQKKLFLKEFVTGFARTYKNKNSRALLFAYFVFTFGLVIFGLSVQYLNQFVLKQDAIGELVLTVPAALGSFVGPILAFWISKKAKNIDKIAFGLLYATAGACALLFFAGTEYRYFMYLGCVIFGLVVSLFTVIITPLINRAWDELALKAGKRVDGELSGLISFITQVPQAFAASILFLMTYFTGFDPTLPVQSDLAILGIRVTVAFVPGIFIAIAATILMFSWDLDRAKHNKIVLELEERGINFRLGETSGKN
jgi:GPH family glycoside/pentoside/hexuronide:cation symporter